MTYGTGQKVLQTDFNQINSDVNDVLGTGNADYGYGQSGGLAALTGNPVIDGDDHWKVIRTNILTCATHQGTATANLPPANLFDLGDVITAYPPTYDLLAMVTSIRTNRLVADAGSLATTLDVLTSTRGTAWTGVLEHEFTATFTDEDRARWFFNSGGKIQVRASRSGGTVSSQNTAWTNLLSAIGTVSMDYTATTQTGAGGTTSAIGYYDLTGSYQTIFTQNSSGAYASNQYKVEARREGFTGIRGGNGSVVRVKVTFNDAHSNAFFDSVDGTLTSNVDQVKANTPLTISAPTWANTITL